ncbi:hypothetical protein ACPXB5_11420 [Micromonospora arida]|uniref:hypothetical protein n=1 Tax=Micromonospora arida TaxID=2203715 RepID=UPI003CE8F33F
MTTFPAADCGVSEGCGACPLGRAGVCGDPDTELPGMWERADFTGGLDEVRGAPAIEATRITPEEFRRQAIAAQLGNIDTADRDPAEPRPAAAGCCGGRCGGGLDVVTSDEGDPLLTN